MNTALSTGSGLAYRHAIKPLLFLQKPDKVHERLLLTASHLERHGSVHHVLRAVWAYRNATMLSQRINDITFVNPVGLSAGFDKNFDLVPLMESIGFGFMEGGSVTLHNCAGNPRPWFYRLPKSKSLVVHAGLANNGVDAAIKTLQSYVVRPLQQFPVNISVAKTNSPEACTDSAAIDDYTGSLKRLERANVGSMYTLNISCPNTFGGEPFTTPARLEKLLHATDQMALSKPLFIKMPADQPWKEFRKLVEVASKHSVHGLTMTNLAKDRGAAKLKDFLPDDVAGNLSGMPTQSLSDELIRQTYLAYEGRFTIIGVGGIFSAADAYRKITYGANLVELITGMIFQGPQLIGQINYDLVRYLKRDGLTNISQAVGIHAKKP